jgi:sulfur relay (sulfurtransferase) DsrF/TusC family protein
MEKRLVVVVKSKPYTTLNTYEALRVAVGLWEHEVSVVWMGDGVYALLGAADMSLDGVFHADLPDLDVNAYVDEDALVERGLDMDALIEEVRPISLIEIAKLVAGADASIVF